MEKIAQFFKVSREQFFQDFASEFPKTIEEMEEEQINAIYDMYDRITVPKRATVGSAGYDFATPFEFTLAPGDSVKIPTGIRCQINEGWVLQMYPRSSVGFKYQIQLANTVGIIDWDYYYAKNEGHIWIKLVNRGTKEFSAKEGEKICQGIFIPYGITYDDDAEVTRVGGIGSTGE